jgi:tripeptide aminopeptidase
MTSPSSVVAHLLGQDRVSAARRHLERTDEASLARQAEVSSIPAPTGAEGPRGSYVASLFREAGLRDVRTDEVGNVLAHHPYGPALDGAEPVVLSAHLDTVFGPEVNVTVERRGRRLEGPGISDNARGLAALIAVAEALAVCRVDTLRPIVFAATVGEEGHGDLRGVRHLLNGKRQLRPRAFIALDGAGLDRVVHRALGAKRYRVTFRGPGGHSWAAFGVANPANAVGRATAAIADLAVPADPRTTCAVVRIGGGAALNSIPQEAWLDLDLRSEGPDALQRLDAAVRAALETALQEENQRRDSTTAPLRLEITRVGDRPCGTTPRTHPLVQVAVAATRALGRDCDLVSASTDANVPIALGVPAIAMGAGGRGGDAHLASEWFENTEGVLGLVRAMLVTVGAAQMD